MFKKLAAISLLILFLFNLTGYRAVFYFAQQKADAHLTASLDKEQYNEKDLIAITVPVSMPYQVNKTYFERVDGEINVKGQIYKYVKRKIQNGQLILLCLPNHEKMRLQSAKDDFSKMANDLVQNGATKKSDNSKSFSIKNITLDYDNFQQQYAAAAATQLTAYSILPNSSPLFARAHQSPEQPPDAV